VINQSGKISLFFFPIEDNGREAVKTGIEAVKIPGESDIVHIFN
jgi:AICAR transformylase/IMP cyclohydrolase PurH